MSHGQHGGRLRVVIAALLGNIGIAAAKFVAAELAGSVSMLAEAVHSLADTGNQALLLIGMALSVKTDPERYPLGRRKETYFWAFLVSVLLFVVGGMNAIIEGVRKLGAAAERPERTGLSLAVLGVSVLIEASSFTVAMGEFRRRLAGRTVGEALFGGKDPTVTAVLLEDSAALVGLVFAAIGVGVSAWTRSTLPDAVGSIAIGLLLAGVGVVLARDTHGLLVGEAALPEIREQVRRLAESTPGVERVSQLLTMHLGPDAVLLALKVKFSPKTELERLEVIIDDLEARIRADLPQMERIFVEPDSRYDPELDPMMTAPGRGPAQ